MLRIIYDNPRNSRWDNCGIEWNGEIEKGKRYKKDDYVLLLPRGDFYKDYYGYDEDDWDWRAGGLNYDLEYLADRFGGCDIWVLHDEREYEDLYKVYEVLIGWCIPFKFKYYVPK